jgi:hypothetical protein
VEANVQWCISRNEIWIMKTMELEQSVGHMEGIKWSVIDYQQWCSLTIGKWIMIVKPFRHITIRFAYHEQLISIILNALNGEFSEKCVIKWTYEVGKRYIWELYTWEILKLFLWAFCQDFENQISCMGKLIIQELHTRRTLYVLC